MIQKVFIDSDVILDVALVREPFAKESKAVLSIMENNIALGYTSSNCIANVYYILRKAGGDKPARNFLAQLLTFLTVIPIDHQAVLESIRSDFADFEDALQYCGAQKNYCNCIITRNIEDYKKSKLDVYLPKEFLCLYY